MNTNNPLDAISAALDNMSQEEQIKFLPVLKELNNAHRIKNEGIQRKNAFTAQFTTVVGVVFGVLAAFNSIGQNLWADIFYLAGILCCGTCLVLCVVCLCKPIYDNYNQLENAAYRAYEEVVKAFELEIAEEDQPKREKKHLPFREMRNAAYVLFGISIVCVLVKICILFYTAYYC
jgi:hypothetical protein